MARNGRARQAGRVVAAQGTVRTGAVGWHDYGAIAGMASHGWIVKVWQARLVSVRSWSGGARHG